MASIHAVRGSKLIVSKYHSISNSSGEYKFTKAFLKNGVSATDIEDQSIMEGSNILRGRGELIACSQQ